MEVGIKAEVKDIASEDKLAKACGSGEVEVYGSPFMIALMEEAASKTVTAYLKEGQATVGINFDLAHLAATPPNMKVRAEAELTEIEGKKLTFKVRAYDEVEKIGEGIHQRYIIKREDFEAKVKAKANN